MKSVLTQAADAVPLTQSVYTYADPQKKMFWVGSNYDNPQTYFPQDLRFKIKLCGPIVITWQKQQAVFFKQGNYPHGKTSFIVLVNPAGLDLYIYISVVSGCGPYVI